MKNNLRYGRSIKSNLFELHRSLSYRNAYNIFIERTPSSHWSFFSYASLALHDGIFSHAMKVLDKHRDTVSFFYLYKCNSELIENELLLVDVKMEEIELISDKLNKIRNKTHFHIDKNAVFDPNKIWVEANITGDAFNNVMDNLWIVLNKLYVIEFKENFGQPIYDGKDIVSIIDAVEEKNIVV